MMTGVIIIYREREELNFERRGTRKRTRGDVPWYDLMYICGGRTGRSLTQGFGQSKRDDLDTE